MQVGSVSDFGKTAQSQYRRLEVIDFFWEATEEKRVHCVSIR